MLNLEAMETHRYVRNQLVENNSDRYDSIGHRSSPNTEYWTNGTTTLLGLPATVSNLSNISVPAMTTMTASRVCRRETEIASSSRKDNSATGSQVVRNSLLAGSVAGMVSTLVCHPFDVLRVKMQSTALTTTSVGVSGTFQQTLQYGGFRALYTGLAFPLAAQAVYKATVFTINNLTQEAIVEWRTLENYKLGNFQNHQVTLADHFVGGFMGGAVNAALFVTPVEFIRNHSIIMQNSERSLKNVPTGLLSSRFAMIRQTIAADGVIGLWRGLGSTVLRDSVGCGCFFVAMAFVQNKLSVENKPPSHSSVILSGAAAGVAFWLWSLPIDTMKTWIQSGTARNMRHAFQLIKQKGYFRGIPSLFRGWQVAYGRGAPSAAITVVTYSLAYQYLAQDEN